MEELQSSIDFIDWKQGFYDDVLSGKTAYYSNLIPEQYKENAAERPYLSHIWDMD